MLTKTKKNHYETLTKKSFDLFLKILKDFSFDYIHSSDRRVYLKGKNTYEKIKEITMNSEFKDIYSIWEQLENISDVKSDKYLILKNKLDIIRLCAK